MPESDYWCGEGWRQDEARKFQVALGASILLHAAILFGWKLSPELQRVAEHPVLTVVLRGATTAEVAGEKAFASERELATLTRKVTDTVSFSVQAKPEIPAPAVVVTNRLQMAAPGRQAKLAPQANSGRASVSPAAPVGVSVLLVIGGDGRVSQIFWNKLPALTNEQLRRVEAAIQAKTYAPGQTVSEVFDVREFLKLPPVPPVEGDLTPTPLKSD